MNPILLQLFFFFFFEEIFLSPLKVTQLKGNPCALVSPEVNLQFDFSPNIYQDDDPQKLIQFYRVSTVKNQFQFSYKNATKPAGLHKLFIAGSTCSL